MFFNYLTKKVKKRINEAKKKHPFEEKNWFLRPKLFKDMRIKNLN